jgi:hypothetical protein
MFLMGCLPAGIETQFNLAKQEGIHVKVPRVAHQMEEGPWERLGMTAAKASSVLPGLPTSCLYTKEFRFSSHSTPICIWAPQLLGPGTYSYQVENPQEGS